MMNAMPKIHVASVETTPEESPVLSLIVGSRGATKGCLRASKPKVVKGDKLAGRAAYVWRMVAFQISPKGPHQCMPCTANFDLQDEDWTNRRAVEDEMDKLVKKIVDSVPKEQWYGIRRWGHAFYG